MFLYCSGDDEATRFEKEKRDLKRSGETASKQAELNALLATPLIQSGFSGKYPTMTGKLELPKSLEGSQVYSQFQNLVDYISFLVWLENYHAVVRFNNPTIILVCPVVQNTRKIRLYDFFCRICSEICHRQTNNRGPWLEKPAEVKAVRSQLEKS